MVLSRLSPSFKPTSVTPLALKLRVDVRFIYPCLVTLKTTSSLGTITSLSILISDISASIEDKRDVLKRFRISVSSF